MSWSPFVRSWTEHDEQQAANEHDDDDCRNRVGERAETIFVKQSAPGTDQHQIDHEQDAPGLLPSPRWWRRAGPRWIEARDNRLRAPEIVVDEDHDADGNPRHHAKAAVKLIQHLALDPLRLEGDADSLCPGNRLGLEDGLHWHIRNAPTRVGSVRASCLSWSATFL